VIGLDRYIAELGTPLGRVVIVFEGREGPRVAIRHPEPFFRALEQAWNDGPNLGERDVHARFWELVKPESGASLGFKQRVSVVSAFLNLAAVALDVLASGQHSEVASLEEHARQLRLNPKTLREVL
jgi:hypothetical protein